MNNNTKNFKIHQYVTYECAICSEGYSKVLIMALPRTYRWN
jgi:hypothetical protein